MGIPSSVLTCLMNKVDNMPRKSTVVLSKTVQCVDSDKLGVVMGNGLPDCMDKSAVGSDAKSANNVLTPGTIENNGPLENAVRESRPVKNVLRKAKSVKAVAAEAPKSVKTSVKKIETKVEKVGAPAAKESVGGSQPVNALSLLGVVSERWNCQQYPCFCYCDSGCHYCCSYSGVGIPGQPGYNCFLNVGCPPHHVVCN